MRNMVGPTAEYNTSPKTANIRYGDATVTARRHLSPREFPQKVVVAQATDDNGWLGPIGIHSPFSPSGSLYGYGVAADKPMWG